MAAWKLGHWPRVLQRSEAVGLGLSLQHIISPFSEMKAHCARRLLQQAPTLGVELKIAARARKQCSFAKVGVVACGLPGHLSLFQFEFYECGVQFRGASDRPFGALAFLLWIPVAASTMSIVIQVCMME